MAEDPFKLFETWFGEAKATEPNDPDAMALATANVEGRPSVRMVLLKGHDPRGFVFYTNLDSRKGGELATNPNAALLFHWKSLRRQVRIEGTIGPVSSEEADAYFASRGRRSRIGAWASDQSRPLDRRETFVQRVDQVSRDFDGQDVPRPSRWSGFRVLPETFEFWEDGEHRLHHRRVFTRADGHWNEGLLYP